MAHPLARLPPPCIRAESADVRDRVDAVGLAFDAKVGRKKSSRSAIKSPRTVDRNRASKVPLHPLGD
jgi:hypothetical protein